MMTPVADDRAAQLAAGDEPRDAADERLLADLAADSRQVDELLRIEADQ